MGLLLPILFVIAFMALVVWLVPKLDPRSVRPAHWRHRSFGVGDGRFNIKDDAWRNAVATQMGTVQGSFARLMKKRYGHDPVRSPPR